MSAGSVKGVLARQITDEDDLAGLGSYKLLGVYGRPVFVIFDNGRWCSYAREASTDDIYFCADPPDAHDLYLVGLLTRPEYVEAMLQ